MGAHYGDRKGGEKQISNDKVGAGGRSQDIKGFVHHAKKGLEVDLKAIRSHTSILQREE